MAEELKALTAAIQHELELARAGESYEEQALAEEIVDKLVTPLLAEKWGRATHPIRHLRTAVDELESDLERTEASRRAWAEEAEAVTQRYQDLLGSLWLYVDWRYVTKQLTTEQKALFADAVDAGVGGDPDEDGPRVDRWWLPRVCTCGHAAGRHLVLSDDPPPGCRDCECRWFLQGEPPVSAPCACVTDEQAAAIEATRGFSRPVCKVHPEGGAQ